MAPPSCGPHRLWRIRFLESSSTGWEAYIKRVDIFTTASPGVPHRSGRAYAQATAVGNAQHAFDEDLSTSFRTGPSPGSTKQWLSYNAGAPIDVVRVVVHQFGSAGNHIEKMEFLYSDDNEVWHSWFVSGPVPVNEPYDSDKDPAIIFFSTVQAAAASGSAPTSASAPAVVGVVGAHRFWRIRCTKSNSNGWEAYFREISFYSPFSPGKPFTGGKAFCGPEDDGSLGNPALAFDNNPDTFYRTGMDPGSRNEWVAYDAGTPVEVVRVVVRQWGGHENYVEKFEVQYSDDARTWITWFTSGQVPFTTYDSEQDKTKVIGPTTTRYEPAAAAPAPAAATPMVIYEGGARDERNPGQRMGEVVDVLKYAPYIMPAGKSVRAFMGERVAIIVDREVPVGCSLDHAAHQIMEVVWDIEDILKLYDDVIGKIPALNQPFKGRIRYEVAMIPAAGLACHGQAGIATGPAFLEEMIKERETARRGRGAAALVPRSHDAAVSAGDPKRRVHHVFFYETMRNYIFEEDFTHTFDYFLAGEDSSCWGWVNQGWVNITGCLIVEDLPLIEFNYYGRDREGFRKYMEGFVDRYISDRSMTWDYVFNNKKLLPWDQHTSLDNMYSGILSKLCRLTRLPALPKGRRRGHCSWFLKRWFRGIPRLRSRLPQSKADVSTARENFYLAATYAAQANVDEFFFNQLRWPVRAGVPDLAARLLAESVVDDE